MFHSKTYTKLKAILLERNLVNLLRAKERERGKLRRRKVDHLVQELRSRKYELRRRSATIVGQLAPFQYLANADFYRWQDSHGNI
jgi:hypothetical protein